MDERVQRLLTEVPDNVLRRVAAGALGLPAAALDGGPSFAEIRRPHAEERTIAIVRVTGRAAGHAWSSVIKVLDLSIPAPEHVAGLTRPEYEELVYERGYFQTDGLKFRPARCHAVTRPEGEIKLLWLEDLTEARSAPFTLDEVARMARDLGEWNGYHLTDAPDFGFPIGRDGYRARVSGWNHAARLQELAENADHAFVRAAYPGGSIDPARRLLAVLERLVERVAAMPHALAFGDCAVGNVFWRPTETVAIDWASLTVDPVGVDGGCLVGSCLSWGPDFMKAVRAERDLSESYVAGLRAGGWSGEASDLRRAALAQIGGYLMVTAILPGMIITQPKWIGFVESRFGLPKEEVCERLADLIGALPGYADEMDTLLAG